ncbi:DUF668 domain-containing protein/DUF3475 domain-containing protein [Quillaja saponaria]|uniref:DUF668 domain-containing protein/DUF3475 domain-containing protein n=1 Tax=Quillaja saponaria TaxID=32244 RepID=A0AAD7Q645_QUISA|nr:DUF668 domain-containing protein/DUF3475 domain-containing protein [Quillaja saponaria]
MALETLLIKVKNAISHSFDSVRPTSTTSSHPKLNRLSSKSRKNVAVLAFEIAGLMSKLVHLYQSLSDSNIIRLRNDAISLEGVRKIISNDESFLLSLACAEFVHNLRLVANSVSRLTQKCDDPNLKSFDRLFTEFVDSGRDPCGWNLTNPKEIESKHKKIERYVTLTATLYRELDELAILEHGLKKLSSLHNCNDVNKDQKILELQEKICWQRQEVKDLKDKSLWNRSYDSVVSLLVRSIFTVVARIKAVFGIGQFVPTLSRSLSASATVYPSDHQNSSSCNFVSGPLKKDSGIGFFESHCKLLKPPASTLGSAALALHYANLIIVMEKMIKSPQLVGIDARDDLYGMLPCSIRSALRSRLKGVGFSASDPVLAGEWRDALGKILGWLSPMAHNMIKWQSERSFEQQNLVPKTNVLLLQTLFFANKEKTEAAITELLVGLNYIWRFEREMTAKALFECNNFNGFLNMKKSS